MKIYSTGNRADMARFDWEWTPLPFTYLLMYGVHLTTHLIGRCIPRPTLGVLPYNPNQAQLYTGSSFQSKFSPPLKLIKKIKHFFFFFHLCINRIKTD